MYLYRYISMECPRFLACSSFILIISLISQRYTQILYIFSIFLVFSPTWHLAYSTQDTIIIFFFISPFPPPRGSAVSRRYQYDSKPENDEYPQEAKLKSHRLSRKLPFSNQRYARRHKPSTNGHFSPEQGRPDENASSRPTKSGSQPTLATAESRIHGIPKASKSHPGGIPGRHHGP